jgi:uncharacterized protein (TIGR03086 family)
MTTALPALNDLGRALTSVTRLTASIGEDQWTWDTPGTEWNVHALLNHLHTGNLSFAAQLRGEPAPQGGVNHLGTDPHGAFLAGANDLLESFARPGVLDTMYESPMGPAPGSFLLQLRVGETFVHGWDLARATSQPPTTHQRWTVSRPFSAAAPEPGLPGLPRTRPSWRSRPTSTTTGRMLADGGIRLESFVLLHRSRLWR